MKINLGVRLFLSYLLVIVVAVVVLAVAAQFALPGAYGRHLSMMEGMPASGEGMWTGMGGGRGQGQAAGDGNGLFSSFRTSFNEALVWAGLVTVLVALCVSFFVSRRLSSPIHAMTLASQRISEGHYDERVRSTGNDEVGHLASSFNRMAEKLEQTESMRRQLIGDVSHELRTPLTAIRGSMEGLIDGILPANIETFTQIHQEANRLSRLVDDLQELSRVEAGAFQMDLKPVPVSGVVDFAVKRFSRSFKSRGVTLTSDILTDLPLIMADEDRLGQVLLNLVGNALQYTPQGGKVTIHAEIHDHEMYVSVADTGVGIPGKFLPYIFDRFYRVDKSRSRQTGGGSGIGLTIAMHLIEAHGGRLWAESEGENRGSTFTFTIPLASG